MSKAANISPHGWYVGSYLLRFVELSAKSNGNLRRRFLTWENTIIVKARSISHAYDRVSAVARKQTRPYKGGANSVNVRWLFEGVTELLPIYEKIGDGAEIMWAEHRPSSLKSIRARVRTKSSFKAPRK